MNLIRITFISTYLLLFMIIGQHNLFSQNLDWGDGDAPSGGPVDKVILNDAGFGVSVSSRSGLYLTNDQGENWEKIESIPINDGEPLDVNIGPDSTIYYLENISGRRTLFSSSDFGSSWIPLLEGQFTEFITMENILYGHGCWTYSDKCGVIRSVDGGHSWEILNVPGSLRPIRDIVVIEGKILIITRQDGVYESSDGGFNFFESNDGISESSFTTLRSFSINKKGNVLLNGRGIYQLDIQANSWDKKIDTDNEIIRNSYQLGDKILYEVGAGFNREQYLWSNGIEQILLTPEEFTINSFSKKSHTFATNYGNTYFDSNNLEFKFLNKGIVNHRFGDLYSHNDLLGVSTQFPTRQFLYDEGMWKEVTPEEYLFRGDRNAEIFITNDKVLYNVDRHTIYKSEDLGDSWSIMENFETKITSAYLSEDNDQLFVGLEDGIVTKSLENNSISRALTSSHSISSFTKNLNGIYAAGGGALYKYDESEISFNPIRFVDNISLFDSPPNCDYLVLSARVDDSYAIYKTYDEGQNFDLVFDEFNGDPLFSTFKAFTNNIWAVLGRFGILFTTDGGENWEEKNDGINTFRFSTKHLDAITYQKENDLLFVTTSNHYAFKAIYASHFSLTPQSVINISPQNGFEGVSLKPLFEWQKNELAESYHLQLSSDEDFEVLTIDSSGIEGTELVVTENLDSTTEYFWRVNATNDRGTGEWSEVWSFVTEMTTSISRDDVPTALTLRQNYPNPFNPSTLIRYGIPESSPVRLEVYNIIGQRVAVLVNEKKNSGWHDVIFNASHLSSGIFLYRIQVGDFVESKQLILIK